MGGTGKRWAAAAAALLATTTLGVAPAVAAPDPGSVAIDCSSPATRTTVTVTSHLDPSCTYTGGFDVTASNVTLDCQGALIDGGGQTGAGIEVRTPADVDLSGVIIRNCRVTGFTNGIRATRTGFRSLAAGQEYLHHLSDVVVEDDEVFATRGVGVFVDGFVTNTTIRRTTIRDAGSSGIYLEAGSADNVVTGNRLEHNGYGENGAAGSLVTVGGHQFRFWGIGREGISVDGSRRNTITGNTITGSSAGGIFLYKNCGEYVHQKPDTWFERRYGADDNLLSGNTIRGGTSGIWVGSRMGENTLPMDCSDPAYLTGPLDRYALDHAARNVVRGNTIADVTYGVRIEDDDTTVEGNRFSGGAGSSHAVLVGTPKRTSVLHQPVRGTKLVGNTSTIAGDPSPYRWVDGEAESTVSGNRALGRDVGWCQGQTPPRGPFVFVIAFALEDPGDPPATPPDPLAIPVIGHEPACAAPVTTTTAPLAAPPSDEAPAATPVAGDPSYTG